LSGYAIRVQALAHIAPLNEVPYLTAHSHLSDIQSLCGKIPVIIKTMKVGEPRPLPCAVFPISADANVYLGISDGLQDATKELGKLKASIEAARHDLDGIIKIRAELDKVQDKDITDTERSTHRRKQDFEARLRASEDAVIDLRLATT
jgi:valyl-tRNA synthetase